MFTSKYDLRINEDQRQILVKAVFCFLHQQAAQRSLYTPAFTKDVEVATFLANRLVEKYEPLKTATTGLVDLSLGTLHLESDPI